MQIAILTIGSRGDVQPYLALACHLSDRGHEVTLAAPANFRDWIEGHRIRCVPYDIDMEGFLQRADVKALMAGQWWRIPKMVREVALPMVRSTLEGTWEAAADADVILYHPKALGAEDVAERTGAHALLAAPLPFVRTGEFPIITSAGNYGAFLNRLSWSIFRISRLPYAGTLNRWRKEVLGLGPGPRLLPPGHDTTGRPLPRLTAVSSSVVPFPHDWNPQLDHLTGYWWLDDAPDWSPPAELQRFLEAGTEPPIYIGFGSMTARDPQRLARTVVDAVRTANLRAVIATGWGALRQVEADRERILVIDGAPHAALFPLMAGVVHHGGAGTTAAGLRAARPTLICPFAVDQPFWGKRTATLGVGPPPLPAARLEAAKLASSLRELVEQTSYAHRAREIADRLALEDGCANAAALIEQLAGA
ncbi:MAG: glycosyltransferase [Pseudomonadota bacterium]